MMPCPPYAHRLVALDGWGVQAGLHTPARGWATPSAMFSLRVGAYAGSSFRPTNGGASCLSPMLVAPSVGRRHNVVGKVNLGVGGQMDPGSNADDPMDEKLLNFS